MARSAPSRPRTPVAWDSPMLVRRRLTLRRAVVLTLLGAGVAISCAKSSTEPDGRKSVADAAATVAQVAAAVTGQDALLADEQLDGKHLGFDTHTYPGDKTMRAW